MKNCLICLKLFEPSKSSRRGIYCSVPCRQKGISIATAKMRGDKLRGRGEGKGYKKLNGRHEHRILAEEKIGRPLIDGEVVHHLDGNKRNNSPENLVVITQSIHAKIHQTKNRKCEVENCLKKHVAFGLCGMHYQRMKNAINRRSTNSPR